jgi:hypothetical protein
MINIRSILKLANNDGLTLKRVKRLPIRRVIKSQPKVLSAIPQERLFKRLRHTAATVVYGIATVFII